MTAWDIEPSGVQGVVGQTNGIAKGFEGQLKTFETAMTDAATQSSSSIVGQALVGFAEANRKQVEFVLTRTGACLNAAVQATNAYVRGDLVMAANAQRSASAAPQAKPPGN